MNINFDKRDLQILKLALNVARSCAWGDFSRIAEREKLNPISDKEIDSLHHTFDYFLKWADQKDVN